MPEQWATEKKNLFFQDRKEDAEVLVEGVTRAGNK